MLRQKIVINGKTAFFYKGILFTDLSIDLILQASILVEACEQINVGTTTTATTFYGIPEPVTSAKVINNTITSDCVIEWKLENEEMDFFKYLVKY